MRWSPSTSAERAMPEMIEVELYRQVAELAVGHVVEAVDAPDPWYLKRGTTAEELAAALVGATSPGTRRIGKLLLLDTDAHVRGLRFGMTGRLVVGGQAPIERLEYASARSDPAWIRFTLAFEDGMGDLQMVDPRRLGGVELDPDESRLGIDALSIAPAQLRDALAGSTAPLKARLLDQAHVAGLGHLLVNEVRSDKSSGGRGCQYE